MEYYPQRNKGFAIDYDLAEELDIANEYLEWEEGSNDAPLLEIFEEKFGVEPEKVTFFEYVHGGYIQSLQGFDYDATYVLFDPQTEEVSPEQWDNLISILEDKDVDVIEGSWAELG
tara:strand:+ start:879 stop:1226 length:348 start_codon:yes stop_codon:yes gene_type:complete